MAYFEKYEQASEHARLALERLLQLRISPHPDNFSIWYAYFSGQNPDLCRTIDEMEAQGTAFDELSLAALYDRYFGSEAEAKVLRLTSDRVHVTLDETSKALQVAGKKTGAYGDSLEGFSQQALKLGDFGELKRVVTNLIDETRSVADLNNRLGRRLKTSAQELAHLRRDLESVRREAETDGLTGLANRRSFDFALREAALSAETSREPLSLVLIDIDHFKKFNDTYGHTVGDEVLKLVARVLKEAANPPTTAARYGGEEFALIMPDTPPEQAALVAEHVRDVVSRKRIVRRTTGEALGKITMSAGIGAYSSGVPLADFIQRADSALYLAKNRGRNCVVVEAG